jgi:methyl-accepting chemotaxis protein
MKNIRIGSKVVGVVILLAIIAIAAVGFSIERMSSIGQVYSNLINGSAKEAIYSARANRLVAATRADLFTIIAETDSGELQKLTAVLDEDKAKFHQFMDAAKAAQPAGAAKFDSITAEYDRLFMFMQKVAAAGLANRNQEGIELFHKEIREPLNQLTKDVAALVDTTIKQQNEEAVAAGDSTQAAITLTLVIIGAGLVIGVGLALFVARFGIVAPIAAMTRAMQAWPMVTSRPSSPEPTAATKWA